MTSVLWASDRKVASFSLKRNTRTLWEYKKTEVEQNRGAALAVCLLCWAKQANIITASMGFWAVGAILAIMYSVIEVKYHLCVSEILWWAAKHFHWDRYHCWALKSKSVSPILLLDVSRESNLSLFWRDFWTTFQFLLFPPMCFYKADVICFLLQSKQKWCKKPQTEESPIGRKLSDHKLNNRPDADWLQLKPLAGRHSFSAFSLAVRFKVMAHNLWRVACNLLYSFAAVMQIIVNKT